MAIAQPAKSSQSIKDSLKQGLALSGFKKQGTDDSILVNDPYYDSWYEFDENSSPKLPSNFAERLGIHLMVLNEKHTTHDSIIIISELLNRHINNPKMYVVFFKVLRLFLGRHELYNYLSTIWGALVEGESDVKTGKTLLDNMLRWIIKDFKENRSRIHFADSESPSVKFSFFATEIGDNFIALNEGSPRNLDLIRIIYTAIINIVLESVDINIELSNSNSMLILGDHEKSSNLSYFERYIFNDIYQYIEYRNSNSGQSDYSNLGILHSPEAIKKLNRNLDAIRSQVIKQSINTKLIKRDEEIRDKLKKRSLTDEEMVASTPIFDELINLFYMERRLNFDVRGVELVKKFTKGISVLFGFSVVIYSFIDPQYISLYEGFSVFVIMTFFPQVAFSNFFFQPMYPKDYSAELNKSLKVYFDYFQKMNKAQLLSFCEKQMKSPKHKKYYFLIPDLIIRLHQQFPTKKQKMATRADVYETVHHLQQLVNDSL